jgi:phosphatidylserine decarboxylase
MVGANPAEAELPLSDYETFGKFFARRLRAGARELATDPSAVLSPSDGVISAMGEIEAGKLLQAKGRDYPLARLLDDDALAELFTDGRYATIYLAPRDYHRVHVPVDGKMRSYRHIPGRLWPVSRPFISGVQGLYNDNERVVVEFDTAIGKVVVVLVAAAGVGNLVLFQPAVEFRRKEASRVVLDTPLEVEAGQELGAFQLGSTVICLFQKKAIEWLSPAEGSIIRQGEALAKGKRRRA